MKPDWSRLEHAYGNAADVPRILSALTPTPWTDEWDAAWSRLCHQGTVYSASFAALPVLCDLARSFDIRQRVSPIFLASAIVSATDVTGVRSELVKPYEDALPALASIAEDTLAAFPDLADTDYLILLEARIAFLDHNDVWASRMESLKDGKFYGACPACERALSIDVRGNNSGVSGSNNDTDVRPLVSGAIGTLAGSSRWLSERLQHAGLTVLVQHLLLCCGESSCPYCNANFSMVDAIATLPDE